MQNLLSVNKEWATGDQLQHCTAFYQRRYADSLNVIIQSTQSYSIIKGTIDFLWLD